MNPVDYSLYLVTDSSLALGRPIRKIVEAAIRGGVTIVQYREKNAPSRQMISQAEGLMELCRANHIPFIVNDRVDVALAVGADGVHVGQDDMPAALVRKLIGPEKIIGVSAEGVAQAQVAALEGADYVGASPIFATPTKPDAPPPIGALGLKAITRGCTVPVVAIGGLNAKNAESMIRAGASGVAVVSAIMSAEDVESATREIRRVIGQARSVS
jgi:thiamine-phosphate pyrophosphorylase